MDPMSFDEMYQEVEKDNLNAESFREEIQNESND